MSTLPLKVTHLEWENMTDINVSPANFVPARDWLREKGGQFYDGTIHAKTFTVIWVGGGQGYLFRLNDHRLATLFKLTWGGK